MTIKIAAAASNPTTRPAIAPPELKDKLIIYIQYPNKPM
jgi:hypothetical protein